MCLGGPNHCRVGWMGIQSYLLLFDKSDFRRAFRMGEGN
jgi:hypothetical protein